MKLSAHNLLLAVYVAVSIATFQHTAWGFGTLAGAYPAAFWPAAWWWIMGGLMAGAVDVGMGVIVWLKMQSGERTPAHIWTLAFLAAFSAYAQLLFASHHAAAYTLGDVPGWLHWLRIVLDARTLVLPLALPGLALIAGFVAKQEAAATVAHAVPRLRRAKNVKQAIRTAEVKRLKQAGHTKTAIADAMGISVSTVDRELRKAKSMNGKVVV